MVAAFLTATLLCSGSAFASEAKMPKGGSPATLAARTAKALPPLLQEVEAKYAKAETLEAKFSQVTENATLGKKKTSSGILMVKRPDKVRWETLTPDKNLLVSDGKTFWFYTPPFDESEKGQVVERKSTDVQSKLAQALLSGSFSAARDMKVQEVRPFEFSLTPKPGTSGTVQKATIEIDPVQKLIKRVRLEHRDGNRAEIILSEIELGKTIDSRFFRFDPPPGTDVIRQ